MYPMRRIISFAFIILASLAVGLASVPVRAADPPVSVTVTDAQAELIKQNCKQAQSLLQRLQTADVVTRVNRGRIYESLLNRLITPFNARVSFNRYDANALTTVTSTLNQRFTDFKSDYQIYADSLSNLLAVDCEAHPRPFYTLLVSTRDLRGKVATDVADINTLIDRYTVAFGSLRSTIERAQ